MNITGKAKLAGVIGDPISHSLSPRLHAHWLETYGIDGAYVPLKVAREFFAVALRGLRLAGFMGFNVTVPHKEAAFALADRVDDAARAAGAVNLLILHKDHIEGRNTDSAGLSASFAEQLGANFLLGKIATLIGAGGATRAAIIALDALGTKEIRIVARNRSRGDVLARDMKSVVKAQLQSSGFEDWNRAAAHAALLVNTTSAGMRGNPPLALSPRSIAARRCRLRHRLQSARDAIVEGCARARTCDHRWSRHVDAPSRTRVRSVLRCQAGSHACAAQASRRSASWRRISCR